MTQPALDVITIGRSSVDLYGQQVGGRLEDMASFSKAVGGCPSNIAIGTARLGLKSALITRVGDEAMGRFIREQMEREGVATAGIRTDEQRLTALVILGVRDEKTFPLIFYRENCADMALDEDDIDEKLVVVGRRGGGDRHAFLAGQHGGGADEGDPDRQGAWPQGGVRRRLPAEPWGLAGHDAGEERYVRSDKVTEHLKPILPSCDLIVGTEEELHIAGGFEDTLAAIRAIRAVSHATIVCKRGPMGCVVFPGEIPDALDKGVKGPGFPVEVYNVLGAGDAFLSGFLRGWLKSEPLETCCAYANASGAFAVSRLLCSPEIPTFAELQHFLKNGSPHRALRLDPDLNHVHWATTRRPQADTLMAFAIDHRAQFEAMAQEIGADVAKVPSVQMPRGRGDGAGRRRPGRLRHADRRHLRARGALSRRRPSVLDRPSGRGARLAPTRFRGRRRYRRESSSNGPSDIRSSASASITRTIRTSLKQAPGARAFAHHGCGAADRPRASHRDHRGQERPVEARHRCDRAAAPLRRSASSPIGGSSNRRRMSPHGGQAPR